ncbi:hypothetical protein LX32DRAFT_258871 [Colletotrichum zoysiae]|uniref:Uncharacterized protein n=1 Tax=Colletotrichum zoysiae TaxID=1216348 RepID=A0AAD9H3Y0_9PEZI|nr:hypothetical protein LX32DRAFT_258871 [Colletotrichum zoysiae]
MSSPSNQPPPPPPQPPHPPSRNKIIHTYIHPSIPVAEAPPFSPDDGRRGPTRR